MKKIIKNTFVLFFLLNCFKIFSHSQQHYKEEKNKKSKKHHHHSESNNNKVGSNTAITKISSLKGIELSSKAIKALELKHVPLTEVTFKIPLIALVRYKGERSIYRKRESFYQQVPVQIKEFNKSEKIYLVTLKLNDIKTGDLLVTEGAELLRIAQVYALDKNHYGHSH